MLLLKLILLSFFFQFSGYFIFIFIFILFIFFKKKYRKQFQKKKNNNFQLFFFQGALDPNEQLILVTWYNSLTSKGILNWNVTRDLCGQAGVICGITSRLTQLYLFASNKDNFGLLIIINS